MDKERRRDEAVQHAAFFGFEPGESTLVELEGGRFCLFSVGGVEYLAVKDLEVVAGCDALPEPEGFAAMARAAGLPRKIGYNPHEVAEATGVSYSAVCRCTSDGSLQSYLPRGMKRGRLMTPAMVDAWLEGGR